MKAFDVYAYGVISSSTLHLLRQPFPAPDGYAEIGQTHAMTGGEALNSAIVLSRLGLRVRLDGNWIGDTADGRWLLATIANYDLDASRLKVKKGYAGVREIVFSDDRTRTIFGNYVDLLSGARKWNVPRQADVRRARMVCVDPPFRAESALVARYAVQAGVPFVSIDCPPDQPLAAEAAAVIVSGEFRDREYPQADLAGLFAVYQARAKGLVIFTVGSESIWYGRAGGPVRRFTPYAVQVADSAGAGDSFRAGVIYGLLKGWGDEAVIRYAAALAALVCGRFPGVLDSPRHREVVQFMRAQG
jgi:sugar/nucleoside kinase (ribokinase family)